MIQEISLANGQKINTLTTKCLIHLHDLLTKNAEVVGTDAVQPPGVKNVNMLESAMSRQLIGSGKWFKYGTVFLNCATLIYGLSKNHAFHNGNKRVAFLALIKHLYVNGYVLSPKLSHRDIYNLLISIADKEGEVREYARELAVGRSDRDRLRSAYNSGKHKPKWTPEEEINYIAIWLQENVISKNKHPKLKVRVSELKKILETKGLNLEQSGTKIKIYRLEEVSKWFGLFKTKIHQMERTYSIGNTRTDVPLEVIAGIRKDFDLTISDGIDNIAFYNGEGFIDYQIAAYKSIIYRLSKT